GLRLGQAQLCDTSALCEKPLLALRSGTWHIAAEAATAGMPPHQLAYYAGRRYVAQRPSHAILLLLARPAQPLPSQAMAYPLTEIHDPTYPENDFWCVVVP